ncbi:hypothetical protein TWF694_007257 [Orbilia ellipsospora]|uniref:Uncharacterized protein n=1 Tax=Orbilia ellipsospora TaxID=2528407 RepID=A0AAV9XIT6_9PEZI
MRYSIAFVASNLVASIEAYTIAFNVLGYDHSQDPVERIPEVIAYDIPGRPGRERCLNIIPPIFREATPAITQDDLYKANNMRDWVSEYFYPDTLRPPGDRKLTLYEKIPYLNQGIEGEYPRIHITEFAVEAILDPAFSMVVGPVGPLPRAIAFYTSRDCLSRSGFHNPIAVVRLHEGEGVEVVEISSLFDSGEMEAQSWEELDENSTMWKRFIGGLPIRPMERTYPNYNSDSEGTTYSDEPEEGIRRSDRMAPGDARVDGVNPWKRNVVILEDFVGNEMIDDLQDSLETANSEWPGIEDWGYYGDKDKPQVRPTGGEYLEQDWVSDPKFSEAYDAMMVEANLEEDTGSRWSIPPPNPNAAKFDFIPEGSKTPLPAYNPNPLFEEAYETYLEEDSDNEGSQADVSSFGTSK